MRGQEILVTEPNLPCRTMYCAVQRTIWQQTNKMPQFTYKLDGVAMLVTYHTCAYSTTRTNLPICKTPL